MAKLSEMPPRAWINAHKGVLDVANWRGQWYLRRWPRHPARIQSAAEIAPTLRLSDASRLWPEVAASYQSPGLMTPPNVHWTPRDAWMSFALSTRARWLGNWLITMDAVPGPYPLFPASVLPSIPFAGPRRIVRRTVLGTPYLYMPWSTPDDAHRPAFTTTASLSWGTEMGWRRNRWCVVDYQATVRVQGTGGIAEWFPAEQVTRIPLVVALARGARYIHLAACTIPPAPALPFLTNFLGIWKLDEIPAG